MISSNQRCSRAVRLLIWYEIIGIGGSIVIIATHLALIRPPLTPDYSRAILFQDEILVPNNKEFFIQTSVQAINVVTGQIRNTDLPAPDIGWVTDGRSLWSIGSTEVVQFDGEKSISYRPKRLISVERCLPFLYGSSPAVIDYTEKVNGMRVYRLLVLEDHEWRDYGEVAFPGPNRNWATPKAGEPSQLIRRSAGDTPTVYSPLHEQMVIVPVANRCHVFHFCSLSGVLSYHDGLDFVRNNSDEASALSPANLADEATEWIKVFDNAKGPVRLGTFEGRIVLSCHEQPDENRESSGLNPTPNILCGQVADEGTVNSPMLFEEITRYGPEGPTAALIPSLDGKTLYLLTDKGVPCSSAQVAIFQDGVLSPSVIRIGSTFASVVRPVQSMVICEVLLIIASGLTLCLLGTRLRNQSPDRFIQRGHDVVLLATLNQRYLARTLDGLLLISPLIPVAVGILSRIDDDWWNSAFFDQDNGGPLVGEMLDAAERLRNPLRMVVVFWVLLVVSQGVCGLTPGKWLCGIQLVTTRLLYCRIARSLLREALMVADIIEVGTNRMLMTDHQQRLGDEWADTVVVNRGSLLEVWNSQSRLNSAAP